MRPIAKKIRPAQNHLSQNSAALDNPVSVPGCSAESDSVPARSGRRLVNRHRDSRRHRNRRGTAAVEFAVCLPVIVLLVFGSIEASSFIFLKQSLAVAAYEGAREAVKNGSDEAQARARAEGILNARTVNDFNINFPGGDPRNAQRGEEVTIVVTAPTNTNSPLAGQFVTNRNISSRVVMVKE